ncbi:MAG: AI-2E family transporter [Clostridium sp.]|uniref:AI-2E family transporter n=1 Tax=Clostridium sp. TaxID=1506 RepID=UPI003F3ED054
MKNFKLDKSKLLLYTYVIFLCFFLFNIKTVLSFLSGSMQILSPFILAFGIAFILNIPMTLIENTLLSSRTFDSNLHIKRTISIILTFSLIILIFSALLFFIIPELISSVKSLSSNIPSYLQSFEKFLQGIIGNTSTFDAIWQEVLNTWKELLSFASKFFGFAFGHVIDFTINFTSSLVNFVLAVVFSIYMLSNKEVLLRHVDKIITAYTSSKIKEKIYYVGRTSNKIFSKFIAGQCLEAVIIGVLCLIGMLILRIPYALLISTIIGFTSIVPIFGAFIGTVPALFLILIISPMKALIFLIFIIVLQQIEGDFIYPKVVGSSVGLSPIWVMLSMLIGGSAFGFLGLLIGIPTFAVFYKLFTEATNKRLIKKRRQLSNSSS